MVYSGHQSTAFGFSIAARTLTTANNTKKLEITLTNETNGINRTGTLYARKTLSDGAHHILSSFSESRPLAAGEKTKWCVDLDPDAQKIEIGASCETLYENAVAACGLWIPVWKRPTTRTKNSRINKKTFP